MYEKIKGPGGLELVLDSSQVFPDDPGNGTPAMVYLNRGGGSVASATYWCAANEGELESYGYKPPVQLSERQLDWLVAQEPKVDKLYEQQLRAAAN